MKVRVYELRAGDRFDTEGLEYQVSQVSDGQVRYHSMFINFNGEKYRSWRLLTMGSLSKRFVNLTSDANNRAVKKKVPGSGEIVGPRPDQEDAGR